MKQKLTELKEVENLGRSGDNSFSIITRTDRQKINKEIEDKLGIYKFRLKLKKGGKITRPFRYDLHHIPYYTVEVINRFKGLDLIDGSL